jgi:hypothetical protein
MIGAFRSSGTNKEPLQEIRSVLSTGCRSVYTLGLTGFAHPATVPTVKAEGRKAVAFPRVRGRTGPEASSPFSSSCPESTIFIS